MGQEVGSANKPLRVALVGVGAMGRHHHAACTLTPGVDMVAVCDLDPRAPKQLDPGLDYHPTFEGLLAAQSCDAVIINTPHHLHDSMAIAAMESGLHVLLEKPMATSTEGCDALIETMERTGMHLSVGHIQRHLPDKVTAKRFLQSGGLGELVAILDHRTASYGSSTRPDWFNHHRTAGGGVLFNLGAHCVDRALWMAGARARSVFAWTRNRFGIEVETDGTLIMQLTDGTPVTVTITSNAPSAVDQMTLIGTKGTLACDPLGGVTVRTSEGTRILQGPIANPLTTACQAQLAQFSADTAGSPRSSNASHARHVVDVLECAYRSAALGGVVTIPQDLRQLAETPLERSGRG